MKRPFLILALLACALPVSADVCAQAGQFTTGTGTTQIDVTTGTCVPKVVLFWTTGNGLGTSTTHANSWGVMADMATDQQRALFSGCANVDSSDCNQIFSEAHVLVLSGGTAATECSLVMTSFNSGTPGFSVTPDDACTSDTTVHYKALGGSDITGVDLQTITWPTSTGTFDTTVGFTGSFALLAGTYQTSAGAYAANANFNIGFTNGTNAALYSSIADDGAAGSSTEKYVRGAAAQLEVFAALSTAGAVDMRVSFDSFQATAVRLNVVEENNVAAKAMLLTIAGGVWDVGDFLTQTSLGTFTDTHSALTGKAITVVSGGTADAQSTSDTAATGVIHSIGFATSSTARGVGWTGAGNAANGNDQYDNVSANDQLVLRYNTTPAITLSVDFEAFTNSTTVTLDQTDELATQTFCIYFIVGESAAATVKPKRRSYRW